MGSHRENEAAELFRSAGPEGSTAGRTLTGISYSIAIEELSRVSAAIGLCITVHNSVGMFPIAKFGSRELKEKYLPKLASGDIIGAFCITEANAGSDAGGVETTAVREGGFYIINGTKIFVTNGAICGAPLIFAVTNPENPKKAASVFVVDKDAPGFSVGECEDLCGMRANPVSSLFLEDCRVPEENIIGKPGDGLKIGLIALDTGRIGIAAQALGIAQAAFEASVRYSKERQQFKKPISSFQTIQNMIADMALEVDAGKTPSLPGKRNEGFRGPFLIRSGYGKTRMQRNGLQGHIQGGSDSRRLRLQQGI